MSKIWSDLRDSAVSAMEQQDYEAANKDWQTALVEAEKFAKSDGRTVATLEGLAQCEYGSGNLAAAESLYKRALEIRESQQGADHEDVATVLNNLGAVYFKRGFYKDAMSSFEKTLAIRRKTFPDNHLEI